eukprot:361855-Chlamydomonas_euryale.AAC.4
MAGWPFRCDNWALDTWNISLLAEPLSWIRPAPLNDEKPADSADFVPLGILSTHTRTRAASLCPLTLHATGRHLAWHVSSALSGVRRRVGDYESFEDRERAVRELDGKRVEGCTVRMKILGPAAGHEHGCVHVMLRLLFLHAPGWRRALVFAPACLVQGLVCNCAFRLRGGGGGGFL